MAVVSLWAVWTAWRHRTLVGRRHLLAAIAAVAPFGFLATEAGWVVTEVGRQPWVVHGVIRTADAVTPMPGLWIPFGVFVVLYVGLAAVVILLIAALVRETVVTTSYSLHGTWIAGSRRDRHHGRAQRVRPDGRR